MGDSLLRQRPPKFGLMTLTSPSWLTHAEITPLTGVGEPGVFMRSANAVEGAASAIAAKTTKDRNELVSIFFTLTAVIAAMLARARTARQ